MANPMAPVGVDPFEEEVYRTVLLRGGASPGEVALDLGATPARVARAMSRLHDKGLLGRMSGSRKRYAAIEPRPALESLVQAEAARLEAVRTVAAELSALFEQHGAAGADEVEIVAGNQALGQWFIRLQQHATQQVRTLDRPPYALTTDNPVEEAAIKRGLVYRAIYAPEALELSVVASNIQRLVTQGEQARVLAGVKIKVAIADDSLAVMPLSLDLTDVRTAVIRRSTLLDALIDYWEICWSAATPIFVEAETDDLGQALSNDDRMLLALLVSGLKDEAIARQLGWSTRTMRRRMAQLLSDLGARNRFQAGALALRRGWL